MKYVIYTVIPILVGLCCARAAEVEGQIYITRKDRETVKMSLVWVHVVEQEAVDEVVTKLAQVSMARARNYEWKKRATALATSIPRMNTTNAATARTTYFNYRSLIISNDAFIASARIVLDDKTGPLTLSNIAWNPIKTVQTDADGVFKIEVPKGDYSVIAKAKRRIVSEEEDYLWILKAQFGKRMLFNNSNLFNKP